MSENYRSPTLEAHGQQMAQQAAEAAACDRPREDWTDLTFDEFQALSGPDRNRLHRADPVRYEQLRAVNPTTGGTL